MSAAERLTAEAEASSSAASSVDGAEPGSACASARSCGPDGSTLDGSDCPPALPDEDAGSLYSASAPVSTKASRRNSLQPPPPISTGTLANPFAPGYALAVAHTAAAPTAATEAELVPVAASSSDQAGGSAAASAASSSASSSVLPAAPPADAIARSPSSQASPNTLRQRSQSVVALPSQLERKQLWLKKAKYAQAQPAMIPIGKRSGFCCF